MAVYERSYKGYAGSLTPEWSRFLVLPRYLLRQVFASKLFLAFFTGCFIPTVVGLFMIYLRHNLQLLEKLGIRVADMALITPEFFLTFLSIQALGLGFILVVIVGPPLISTDLASNGLPLYLARPIRRREYVAGKMTVLVLLLSAVSWLPNLLMFFLQAYLAGNGWLWKNLRIGAGIFLGSWIWITVVSLVALAISASVKRKAAARILLFGVFLVLAAFGGMIGQGLGLWWGMNLNITQMTTVVWASLLGARGPGFGTPVWSAWLTLIVACALSVLLLIRKIRAYEVVR